MSFSIHQYEDRYRSRVLELSLRAWRPVFDKLEPAVPPYVYAAFYPNGWDVRQTTDIEQYLSEQGVHVWIAAEADTVLGWIGIRLHPGDSIGEVYILAVEPDRQRQGVATALLETAFDHMREAGMKIVMVETGDDPGHAASRATYERNGFERWPVARYFREL